jgi:hypothetical protein
MKKSILEQKLTYKALGFMFDDSDRLLDHMIESGNEDVKKHFKNVCAALSMPLIERLENTLGLLNMSKREFFELAIIEALNKADEVMKEVGVDDYIEEHFTQKPTQTADCGCEG